MTTTRSRARKRPTAPERAGKDLDMSALSGRFGYNLRRAHAAVLGHLSRTLDEFGIRPRHYGILLTVGSNPGANQGQVAQALGIARTNFVPMVDRLEERGLMRRSPSETDRRSHELYLTAAGLELTERLKAADTFHELAMRRIIGEAESTELIRTLKRIQTSLAAEDDDHAAD